MVQRTERHRRAIGATRVTRMFWSTIDSDAGAGGLFAELFKIGIVKGAGDLFQEISACWPYGGYIGAPLGSPDTNWYSRLFPDFWRKKCGNQPPSLIPDYTTTGNEPCPDAYRWGLMGDRPSGVRPGLFNIYSNLGLFADDKSTNRLNISGYLGQAPKRKGGAPGENQFEPPDSLSTFFVANASLLGALVNAQPQDSGAGGQSAPPPFIESLLTSRQILPGRTTAASWVQQGGGKKRKLTRKHKRLPKKTKQRKIKRRKESLKQFKKRTKTRVHRLKLQP